ncbi:MAG: ElyC/SanA/YdcF family protein [Bacteroidota bacterium]
MKLLKRFFKILILGIALIAVFILSCNIWIVSSTTDMIYEDVTSVPDNKVALVLGTSNKRPDGSPNPFFEERMETTARLYKQGKVKHILVSGDNSSKYYNEPKAMMNALVSRGIPRGAITLDYAGLRTLDSIVRCKEIFGQDKITIITQPFHSFRALFISDYFDIEAVAMVTTELPASESFKVKLREYLARPKAVWDLYVIKKEPKFLGEKEPLNLDS